MPRSASTFVWQLTYDLINYNHKQHKLKQLLQPQQRPNFIYDVGQELPSIMDTIPDHEYYLIKTHGDYHPSFNNYEKNGQLKIICTIRDPYDLCVSWMDVHQKEQGMSERRVGFEEADSLDKVTQVVLRDINIAEKWLSSSHSLIFRYSDILEDHSQLIKSIVDHIGLEVYLYEKVYKFYQDKRNITEFNVGVQGRGEAFKKQLSKPIRQRFDEFIETYLNK
jgi:hypothetical protein